MYRPLELNHYFNNDGISFNSNPSDGDFDCYGQTYPAEELPFSNKIFFFKRIEFLFPIKDDGFNNNIAFNEQQVLIPSDSYSCLHILGAADGGNFSEPIIFEYEKEVEEIESGLSDFFSNEAFFQNEKAIVCSHYHTSSGDQFGEMNNIKPTIWYDKIYLNKLLQLKRIILADNPCLHIFCMTLQT
jgi:hypothetical protein